MLTLHATWSVGSLWIWAEQDLLFRNGTLSVAGESTRHPFASESTEIAAIIRAVAPDAKAEQASVFLRLPTLSERPLPSPRFAHAIGASTEVLTEDPITINEVEAPAVGIDPTSIAHVLDRLLDVTEGDQSEFLLGPSIDYWAAASRPCKPTPCPWRWWPS